MGVALENARLFDETKRLLAETDARAAELAIINEIGAALAEQLDFQAIIDLVGERVGRCSKRTRCSSRCTTPPRLVRSLRLGRGKTYRHRHIRTRRGADFARHRIGPTAAAPDMEERLGARIVGDRNSAKQSCLGVPDPAGDRVLGVLAVESLNKNAFTDADERLLSTLAATMGVALENARLFDETKRLLTETEHARRDGDHQRDRLGARQATRFPGHHRARRRAVRSIFDTRTCPSASTTRPRTSSHFRTTSTRAALRTRPRELGPGITSRSSDPANRSDWARSRSRRPPERSRSGLGQAVLPRRPDPRRRPRDLRLGLGSSTQRVH